MKESFINPTSNNAIVFKLIYIVHYLIYKMVALPVEKKTLEF